MPGTPKSDFLQSVRDALGRGNVPPAQLYPRLTDTETELEYQSTQIRRRLAENLPTLLDKLADLSLIHI